MRINNEKKRKYIGIHICYTYTYKQDSAVKRGVVVKQYKAPSVVRFSWKELGNLPNGITRNQSANQLALNNAKKVFKLLKLLIK